MSQTVVALYESLADAHEVVEALTRAGFDRNQISLTATDPDEEHAAVLETQGDEDEGTRDKTAGGAIAGGALGGLAGLLFGLSVFTIPGFGPILIAGPIYTAVMGATAGGIAGGLLGALVEAGVPEEEAVFYEEAVRRGYTLVAVTVEDDARADNAIGVLNAHRPIDLQERAAAWKRDDWDAPDGVPDQFEPSRDDDSDQHKYATGAMGEDDFSIRAGRERPPLQTYDEDDTE